jgi:hypothetical protein
VRFGKNKLNILQKKYHEGTIDPKNGADWNQSAPQDENHRCKISKKKLVIIYLAWEVSTI